MKNINVQSFAEQLAKTINEMTTDKNIYWWLDKAEARNGWVNFRFTNIGIWGELAYQIKKSNENLCNRI